MEIISNPCVPPIELPHVSMESKYYDAFHIAKNTYISMDKII
jgi:hypothetical protein